MIFDQNYHKSDKQGAPYPPAPFPCEGKGE